MILPEQLGRYEVESLLGLGGMGAVYKARDPVLDRAVAIKTISPLLLSSVSLQEEYLERFRREARAAGKLSHPNIVLVHDMGFDEAAATPYIVMEYVPGVTLEKVLKENPTLPVAQGLELVAQVASALEEAHRNGVVHRDVKPANVFLDGRGRVKVGDFGVARIEGSDLTQTGLGLGTPGYLAPEIVRGGVADARSDVFALGVLAYRVLTGVKPFAGDTREALAVEIFDRHPAPPRDLRAEIPEHVSAAVLRAMDKDRDARTPSAEAFVADLGVMAPAIEKTGATIPVPDPVAAPPPTQTAVPAAPTVRRRSRLGIGLAVGLIATVLVLGGLLLGRGMARREPAAGPSPTLAPATLPRRPPPASPRVVRPPSQTVPPVPTVGSGGDEPGLDPEQILRETARRAEEKLLEELRKAEERRREQDRKPGDKRRKDEKKRGKSRDREE
jgi:eukaryotic-like serine/threonine-protein kinase